MTSPAAPPDPIGRQAGYAGRGSAIGSMAARAWGAILVLVGLWLFAGIALKLDLPRFALGDLWPLALILLGIFIVLGSGRRGR